MAAAIKAKATHLDKTKRGALLCSIAMGILAPDF